MWTKLKRYDNFSGRRRFRDHKAHRHLLVKKALLKFGLWRINFLIRIYGKLKDSPLEKIMRSRVNLEIKIWNRLSDKSDQLEPICKEESRGTSLHQR